MTIHKSKGLEFPVVILAGMGKGFNFRDTCKPLLADNMLGLACRYADTGSRVRMRTLRYSAVSDKKRRDVIAEEMRLLYVAMTRPREKLIMVGGLKNAEDTLAECFEYPMENLPFGNFQSSDKYLDLILPVIGCEEVKNVIDIKTVSVENIMAAAYICGVTKAFACGGSQAIGAMAFGTQTIPRTDVIVGPGNKFVAEAKKMVYGTVGIDMVAGPTEVFIIADESADPAWVAADLLAQAEHDVVAQPVMATTSKKLAEQVADEIEKQLETLSTKETARKSIENCGLIILCDSLEQAAEAANRKAPEHLELAMNEGEERNKIASLCHNYGSLFIGHSSAEVFGDYAAGLNHTLPTSGSARFTGGLSVRVFLKTVTTLRTVEGSKGAVASATAAGYLGDAEGLAGHARAARIRL